jgi:hypothetical protein
MTRVAALRSTADASGTRRTSSPLMRRMLALHGYDTLSSLTVGAAGTLQLGTSLIEQIVAESKAASGLKSSPHDAALSALVARMIHSLVPTPFAPPVLLTEQELRAFALEYLMPLPLADLPISRPSIFGTRFPAEAALCHGDA